MVPPLRGHRARRLDDALRDLSHEIADTDNASFRAGLRERRARLLRVKTDLG